MQQTDGDYDARVSETGVIVWAWLLFADPRKPTLGIMFLNVTVYNASCSVCLLIVCVYSLWALLSSFLVAFAFTHCSLCGQTYVEVWAGNVWVHEGQEVCLSDALSVYVPTKQAQKYVIIYYANK